MSAAEHNLALAGLHLEDWRPTKDTLHLCSQILGKIRLATTPPRNHWWNVALNLDVRGLTTGRLHHRATTFEIRLDFTDRALVVLSSDGRTKQFALANGLTVADFYERIHQALAKLGVDVEINEEPFDVPMTTPFPEDVEHQEWDSDALHRFWRILDWSDLVFEEFSGWFNGKTSPVQLFWHNLNLAVTRFSGRPSEPNASDLITQDAHSHELITFGFWTGDDSIGEAAYYSYTHPEPEGLSDRPLPVGDWVVSGDGSLAVLRYEAVRTSRDPRTTLLAFCQGAYEAGARLADWDITGLASRWSPTSGQLEALCATAAADLRRPSEVA
jgi:Family of unknown function (DUF5996)